MEFDLILLNPSPASLYCCYSSNRLSDDPDPSSLVVRAVLGRAQSKQTPDTQEKAAGHIDNYY